MKIASLTPVVGAFRILGARLKGIGAPALTVWTEGGEQAAQKVAADVVAAAHHAETDDLEAQKELAAGLAGLSDGRADREDIEHLRRAARLVRHSAELDHVIGEAVRS